ncbi:VOC family protein [Legionella spiritensis]|uniref:Glyoxylase n=1 Tax=Legionella spiritensis TaxID=452 RepID=A0A0W0Z4I7_LEGSP|nr:VOC family protein [Legionella spiritensis]KTD64013.1 glyoxylase [Legionella spiritensis]SNV37169.1 glycoxylase [Legionella spiritensis]
MKDTPSHGEFCWNELATGNLGAAKDFYRQLLGWEYIDHDMGDFTYTIVKSGDKEIAGIWEIPTENINNIPPHWMSYILVDDLEKSLEKANQLGAIPKMPIKQAGEYGKFVVLADPTGAHVALWQSLN